MTSTPEGLARRVEEQSLMQKAQQEMLQVQQESINDLKKMIAILIEKLKKKLESLRPDCSSSTGKGKKKGENSTFENTKDENNFEYKIPKSSSKEQDNSKAEDNHVKRMNALEKHLEAISN